jgi:hypothetical protein
MVMPVCTVESCSNFAVRIRSNIPTGKDSVSMKQNIPIEGSNCARNAWISSKVGGNCIDIQKWLNQYSKETVVHFITLQFHHKDEFKLEVLYSGANVTIK